MIMLKSLLTRLRWQFSLIWGALGTPELVLLALLGLWAGLWLVVNAPLQAESGQLDRRIALLVEEGRSRQDQVGLTHMARADITHDFVNFLPSEEEREGQLGRLHKLADQRSLLLSRADYRIEPVKALALKRLSVRISLQGTYAMQRQFLHDALVAFPNLAVERISLEKTAGLSDSMSTLLDASFYYRPVPETEARL